MQGFGFGLRNYGKALNFIFKKGLAWFFIFPLAFNILLFYTGWEYIGQFSDWTQGQLSSWLDIESWSFWGFEALKSVMVWSVWLIYKIMFFILFAYIGGYVIVILLSPVFSYLSERTERINTGTEYPFSISQLIKDIIRGVSIALRNIFIEIIISIIVFALSFIPIIGWAAAIFLIFVSAYFYGFSFIDYALERKRLNMKQSIAFMSENKGMVVANGLVFSLCLIIPFCGVSLSSFAAIVSVVAGTLSINEMWDKKRIS